MTQRQRLAMAHLLAVPDGATGIPDDAIAEVRAIVQALPDRTVLDVARSCCRLAEKADDRGTYLLGLLRRRRPRIDAPSAPPADSAFDRARERARAENAARAAEAERAAQDRAAVDAVLAPLTDLQYDRLVRATAQRQSEAWREFMRAYDPHTSVHWRAAIAETLRDVGVPEDDAADQSAA